MTMLAQLTQQPPDALLALIKLYSADDRADKIDLGVGVYRTGQGDTPVFTSIKKAERILVDQQDSKAYLGPEGDMGFVEALKPIIFGSDFSKIDCIDGMQTPGGTGGVRLAAALSKAAGVKRIWMGTPSWPNHAQIMKDLGVEVGTFNHASDDGTADMAALREAIASAAPTDAILLHGCCHNPTGMDPTVEQWRRIGEVLAARHIVPLVDFAYQGLGTGLEDDSAGLLALCDACRELAVCTSFSKNFGLYNERVGALTVVADSADHAKVVLSHLKTCARTNYSNPPSHGSSVVQGVLGSSELTALWKKELAVMCDRINSMRKLFVDTLAAKRVTRDFSFLTRQRGMFSFSGLNRDQVQKLRDDHSIYIVGSGRINVAGMTEDNMDTLCSAIATVM